MKLISSFSKFLEGTVNLNKARVEVATNGINTISEFLKNSSATGSLFKATTPQGSFRQKTIIRPPNDKVEFDVDLLFEMRWVEGWDAIDYFEIVLRAFKDSARYKEIVDTRGKTRCVTLDYESDFHIDVVPAVEVANKMYIINRKTNTFEVTDGDGYALWFGSQSQTAANQLPRVVRLLKYLRDSKRLFEIKSILLTTLLGRQVRPSGMQEIYADTPTALNTLVGRLDAYLQSIPNIENLDMSNPVLPTETFGRHWNQSMYSAFRVAWHKVAHDVIAALEEPDEKRSLVLWRGIFGDDFPEDEKAKGQIPPVHTIRDAGEEFLSDLGITEDLKYELRIDATVTQAGWRPFNLSVFKGLLKKKLRLVFRVVHCTVPGPYEIRWKIKNHGPEARGDLRGKIFKDDGSQSREERTAYRGSHYVECYAIRNNTCLAKIRCEVPIGSETIP